MLKNKKFAAVCAGACIVCCLAAAPVQAGFLPTHLDKPAPIPEVAVLGVMATAYTMQCGTGDGFTASMTRPEVGRTIAVDRRLIPLGTQVYLVGLGWYSAEDVGRDIRGMRIDLYMGDGDQAYEDAMQWGERWLTLLIWRGE